MLNQSRILSLSTYHLDFKVKLQKLQKQFRSKSSRQVSKMRYNKKLQLTLYVASAYAPAVFELKPQLADRLARLEELIAFIRSNGLLSMVRWLRILKL